MVYVLFSSSLLASASEWTASAVLDSSFEKLVVSDNRIVAYSQDKTASSSDGINWSDPAIPSFPILDITKSKTGGFFALGYEIDTRTSSPLETKYLLVIKDSQDGLEWGDRGPGKIAYFNGFGLPLHGEIAETEDHFLITVTTEHLGHQETFNFVGDGVTLEGVSGFFSPSNLHSHNGKYFSNFSPPPGPLGNWCYRTEITEVTEGELWSYPQTLNSPIDFQTMSEGLLIGQNGIVREGGETYFGNWKDLGTIQGHENGIGLVIPPDPTGTSVYVSTDHLLTWQEEELPGPTAFRKPIAGSFFNNQWLVLADTGPHTTIYSHPAPEIDYTRIGEASLAIFHISNANFEIIACQEEETFNHAVEITFPENPGSHYRLYTSRDLHTWVRYGLQFPSGSTHQFSIDPALRNSKQIYFKAEEFTKTPVE